MKKVVNDMRSKSVPELKDEIQVARKELSKLILETKVNPKKDTNLISKKKRYLARLLTILTEKKTNS